jgi:hypothetical protein
MEVMLRRSTISRLKTNQLLRKLNGQINRSGESSVYHGLPDGIKYNLCCVRLLDLNFSDWSGWEHRDASMKGVLAINKPPYWNGEVVDKLAVMGEQGIGDEVLWASMLNEVMGRVNHVVYFCDPRLVSIFQRSFPGLDVRARTTLLDDLESDEFDSFTMAADLMSLCRRSVDEFPREPYLIPDPARVLNFEAYRGCNGVSFAGRHGSIDPYQLAPGMDVRNTFNLQYDRDTVLFPSLAFDLHDDLEGVLAFISVMDRVITVPNSILHFAGAVGTFCEIILGENGVVDQLDWHVPLGENPYYGGMMTYKTTKDWLDVQTSTDRQ